MATIEDVVKVGNISDIFPEEGMARVTFPDRDNMTSGKLQILYRGQDYYMPSVGDQCLCLFLGNGMEDGFILGTLYSINNKPNTSGQIVRKVQFGDGGYIEYSQGDLKIKTAKNISVIGNVVVDGSITQK